MGIQINGQTDTVTSTAAGGKIIVSSASFPSVDNLNVTGVSTFSGGVAVSVGSTSAPSISPSGDSNTGIFFPSADTIAFAEGGVEALRINSSGNVGIGVSNPDSLLHLKSTTGNVRHTIEVPDTYQAFTNYSATNSEFSIGYIRNSGVDHSFRFCAADGLSSNEIMRIDSVNSRISIGGNASPNQKLTLTDGNLSLYTTTYSAGEVTHKTITSYAKNGLYSNAYNADAEIAFGKVNGFDVDWTHGAFIAFKTTDNNRDIAPIERLRIDQLGRVTTPYQPSFQAFSSSNTPIGSGTNVLPFNATNFNVGSHYNTSTYRFTAPVAGVYLFSVNLNLYTAPGIMMPAVRINGSSAYYGSRLSGNISGDNNLNLIVLLSLSVNDYVEALSAAQGSSAYISNGAAWTRFEGRLLG